MYHLNNDCWFINLNTTQESHDLHSSHIILLFSRASAKAERELLNEMEFLDFKPDLGSPIQYNLE